MNRLLLRQLKKIQASDSQLPSENQWKEFIRLVDVTYDETDRHRYTLERSLNLSSIEMMDLNEKLKSSYEARLTSILDAIPDSIFLFDEDGRFLEIMSGRNEDLFVDKNEIIGKYLNEVLPLELAEKFNTAIKESINKKSLAVINYEKIVSGDKRYFQGRVLPAKLNVKGKNTVVFVAIDITEIRQAKIQQRLISSMFDSGKEGMVIMDNAFNIISANKAYGLFMQQSVKNVIGNVPPFINGKTFQDSNVSVIEGLKNKGHWLGEINGHDKKGSAYPIWLTINKVEDQYEGENHFVAILTDVSEIKKSRQELEHVATHDFLTDLPNRLLFQDRLEQAISRAIRMNQHGALFFLDLNRFKLINDNLGHHIGDELLREVAVRLKHICRDSDTLSRLGGDEFTLIVEGMVDTNEVAIVVEKIIHVFKTPFSLGEYSLDVNVSIGISVFPGDGTNVLDLIKFADTAMYSAKDDGASDYKFYTQELSNTAFEYFSMEVSLKKAISEQQFFVLYQPQYNIETGKLIGVEALVRWRHPDLGTVLPSKFIHIAETTNLIGKISHYVFETCCDQLKKWGEQGRDDIVIAINISRKQLVDPDFSVYVESFLNKQHVKRGSLEFEITESAILDKEYIAIENLKKLHAMGVLLAIDDFGTGYSSLENLKSFPLTRLKIDRNFVRDVNRDKDDEAIIRATIALAKSFGLKVIAEGVENAEQLAFLKAEGCDEVQGYYFGRPVPADEIKFNVAFPES